MDDLEQKADSGELKSALFKKTTYDAAKPRRWNEQHHKCCFCEQAYEKKFFTVEHFRPKTQAVDDDGTKHVGYWWLAYDFENLFFCCPICNNFKNDSFPLAAGARRLRKHEHPSRVDEQILVVHPTADNPEQHIGWKWVGRGYQPAGRTEKGRRTVDLCRLDRDDLFERRRKHYRKNVLPLLRLWKSVEGATPDVRADVTAYARGLAQASQPFAAMTRAVFSRHGLL